VRLLSRNKLHGIGPNDAMLRAGFEVFVATDRNDDGPVVIGILIGVMTASGRNQNPAVGLRPAFRASPDEGRPLPKSLTELSRARPFLRCAQLH